MAELTTREHFKVAFLQGLSEQQLLPSDVFPQLDILMKMAEEAGSSKPGIIPMPGASRPVHAFFEPASSPHPFPSWSSALQLLKSPAATDKNLGRLPKELMDLLTTAKSGPNSGVVVSVSDPRITTFAEPKNYRFLSTDKPGDIPPSLSSLQGSSKSQSINLIDPESLPIYPERVSSRGEVKPYPFDLNDKSKSLELVDLISAPKNTSGPYVEGRLKTFGPIGPPTLHESLFAENKTNSMPDKDLRLSYSDSLAFNPEAVSKGNPSNKETSSPKGLTGNNDSYFKEDGILGFSKDKPTDLSKNQKLTPGKTEQGASAKGAPSGQSASSKTGPELTESSDDSKSSPDENTEIATYKGKGKEVADSNLNRNLLLAGIATLGVGGLLAYLNSRRKKKKKDHDESSEKEAAQSVPGLNEEDNGSGLRNSVFGFGGGLAGFGTNLNSASNLASQNRNNLIKFYSYLEPRYRTARKNIDKINTKSLLNLSMQDADKEVERKFYRFLSRRNGRPSPSMIKFINKQSSPSDYLQPYVFKNLNGVPYSRPELTSKGNELLLNQYKKLNSPVILRKMKEELIKSKQNQLSQFNQQVVRQKNNLLSKPQTLPSALKSQGISPIASRTGLGIGGGLLLANTLKPTKKAQPSVVKSSGLLKFAEDGVTGNIRWVADKAYDAAKFFFWPAVGTAIAAPIAAGIATGYTAAKSREDDTNLEASKAKETILQYKRLKEEADRRAAKKREREEQLAKLPRL